MTWCAVVKKYPHFDADISVARAEEIAKDPQAVAKHSFYPFLKYDQRWTRFAPKGVKSEAKERPIRFAARLDSCIFSYYRYLLSDSYESILRGSDLSDSVIAYRKIISEGGKSGKSNINFAKEAIDEIRRRERCCVISLDISSFFENLRHDRIKENWTWLLGMERLPADHFSVFKAITRYSYVDVKDAYTRLGYFGEKIDDFGRVREGYLLSKRDVPRQLCSAKIFRQKIASDSGAGSSLIKVNKSRKGIPQGAPLSDLLDLSRICAARIAHLSYLSLESQGAFPA